MRKFRDSLEILKFQIDRTKTGYELEFCKISPDDHTIKANKDIFYMYKDDTDLIWGAFYNEATNTVMRKELTPQIKKYLGKEEIPFFVKMCEKEINSNGLGRIIKASINAVNEAVGLPTISITNLDFRIDAGGNSNYLDARIVIADKALRSQGKINDPVIILPRHAAKSILDAALKFVIELPYRTRYLIVSSHWSYATIEWDKHNNLINLLLVDSLPEKSLSENLPILNHAREYFEKNIPHVQCNFYYNVNEIQTDDLSCASFALNGICNLPDIENYTGENLFEYLNKHQAKNFEKDFSEDPLIKAKVIPVILPPRIIKEKQSIHSKQQYFWKGGLKQEIEHRQTKEKINKKNQTLEDIKQLHTKTTPLIAMKSFKMHQRIHGFFKAFNGKDEEMQKSIEKSSILLKD